MSKPTRRTKSIRSAERLVEHPVDAPAFPAALSAGGDGLTLFPSRILVIFRTRPAKAALDSFVGEHRLIFDDGGIENVPNPRRYAITRTPTYYFLCKKDGSPISSSSIASMRRDKRVHSVAPVYQLASNASIRGVVALLPQGFMVRFEGEFQLESTRVRHALSSLRLVVHENRTRLLRPYTFLSSPDLAANAAHVVAPRLAALLDGLSAQVFYEMVSFVDVAASAFVDPTDTLYQTPSPSDDELPGYQWDMKRVGARYAWGVTTGDSTVNLMLHDGGVLMTHQQLKFAKDSTTSPKPFSQFDMTSLSTDVTSPITTSDHGTQLAGIMYAGHDNASLTTSMSGHAPLCTFTSLRVEGADSNHCGPLTSASIQAAIGYAAGLQGPITQPVLCVACFAGASIFNQPGVLGAIASYPDVVVVVPAGNMSGDIGYTGTLYPNLLIVGGTTQGATPNSSATNGPAVNVPDAGDDVWMDPSQFSVGSQTGQSLSIVAPALGTVVGAGSFGMIACTNSSNTAVVATSVAGTSLAAAHVAGIAALVRSKEGAAFSGAQTVAKILTTAAKSGAPNQDAVNKYTTRTGQMLPDGLWSPQMGYGRIDAAAAVSVIDAISPLGTDSNCAYMMVRSWPKEDGARPYTGGDPNPFWVNGDLIVSPKKDLYAVGPTALVPTTDATFTMNVTDLSTTNIQSGVPGGSLTLHMDNFVFVRVVNRSTTAAARGVRVTCVIAPPSTGLVYPTDYEAAAGMHLTPPDESPSSSYYVGDLAPGASYIARFDLPTGTDFTAIGVFHMCALVRVTAANDIAFPNTVVNAVANNMAVSPTTISSIMQRNLNVV